MPEDTVIFSFYVKYLYSYNVSDFGDTNNNISEQINFSLEKSICVGLKSHRSVTVFLTIW